MPTKKILSGLPDIKDFMSNWLPQLPQSNQISIRDAMIWHARMIDQHADRFAWHFKQLTGINSSEIGEIAQRAMGYSATHSSVELIIAQKLMRDFPITISKFRRRNALAEPMIASIFKEDYQAESQIDIMREIGQHQFGWMMGTVDDVVKINNSMGVVDYNATSDDNQELTSLVNQAKLHLFDYLLADSRNKAFLSLDELELRTEPLAFDFMLNVSLDYEQCVTKPILVPYSGKLMCVMIDAGDAVWQHITKGDALPDWMIVK